MVQRVENAFLTSAWLKHKVLSILKDLHKNSKFIQLLFKEVIILNSSSYQNVAIHSQQEVFFYRVTKPLNHSSAEDQG